MMICFVNYNQFHTYQPIHYIYADLSNENQLENNKNNPDDGKKSEKMEPREPIKNLTKVKNYKNKNSIYSAEQLRDYYRYYLPPKAIKKIEIPKVYETKSNGETYRFNISNPNGLVQVDERENQNVFTQRNIDGGWRIDYGKPRIDIHTKDGGIIPDKAFLEENLSKNPVKTWDFSELKEQGYWYKPSDWTNVEVTLIFKLLDSSRGKDEQHSISIVTRSVTHAQLDNEYKKSSGKPQFFCGGSSYHNNISNEGNIRMKKEQFHIDYEWERYNETLSVGNIYDKKIGFKGIVYNINDTAVKLETWVDTENKGKGPYKKVHELIDNSDWGDNMKKCGAETDTQAITWGSPEVIIKSNDFKFDIYDIEVREIIPPNQNTLVN